MNSERGQSTGQRSCRMPGQWVTAVVGVCIVWGVAHPVWGQAGAVGARAFAFARTETGKWQRLEATGESGTVMVRLDPKRLEGRRVRLLFTDREIDPEDTNPPRFGAVGPQPIKEEGNRFDLGFLEGNEIYVNVSDATYLGPMAHTLNGERSGQAAVEVRYEKMGRLPGLGAFTFRLGELAGDHYTLRLSISDELGNGARAQITFQTLGIIHRFTGMKIVADSGKLSKRLGGQDTQFYRAQEPGDFVVYEFETDEAGDYTARLEFTQAPTYGTWQVLMDGKALGEAVDAYGERIRVGEGFADLGEVSLTAGRHRVRIEVIGRNEAAEEYYIGVGSLVLRAVE